MCSLPMSEAEAAGILASPQFREQLLPITQVNLCRLPILRSATGKVELLPEGYDQATETLTVSTIDYRDDMPLDEAVTLVRDLYSEFEFADGERSLAVTLAGGLTLFTPHLLPEGAHRPCFVVNKNAEGAGATTLARCMTTPVLGTVAFNALPGNQDEMRKLLTSIVCAGKQSLIFDNVSGFLKSPPLEAFLTSPRSGDRGLGGNRLIEAPNLATVYVTGNGLTLSSDMTRRSLQIELHLSYEHAGEREFKRSLDAATLRGVRTELLAAYWALVRHWADKGFCGTSHKNSAFSEWGDVVGGIVEAAGFACPLLPYTPENVAVVDEDHADMALLVEAMVPEQEYTFTQLIDKCRQHEVFSTLADESDPTRKTSNRARLGRKLAEYSNRRIGQRLFVILGNKNSRKTRRYVAFPQATGRAFPTVPIASCDEESADYRGNGRSSGTEERSYQGTVGNGG